MIELIVCSEKTRPMLKVVARRNMHMRELMTRGNIHFFSMFRDPITKPYHGFQSTISRVANLHTHQIHVSGQNSERLFNQGVDIWIKTLFQKFGL